MKTDDGSVKTVLAGVLLLLLLGVAGAALMWFAEDWPAPPSTSNDLQSACAQESTIESYEPNAVPAEGAPAAGVTQSDPELPESEVVENPGLVQVTVKGTVADTSFTRVAGAQVAVGTSAYSRGRRVTHVLETTLSETDGSFSVTLQMNESEIRDGYVWLGAWASYQSSPGDEKRYSEELAFYAHVNPDRTTATATDVYLMIQENRIIEVLSLDEDGTPVPGATVWWQPNVESYYKSLSPDPAGARHAPDGKVFEATTGAGGMARLSVPANSGNHCVLVVAETFMPAFEYMPPARRDAVDQVEFWLARAAGRVVLDVVDSEGRPVVSREVQLRFADSGRYRHTGSGLRGELRTDDLGRCVVPDFPTADWLIAEFSPDERRRRTGHVEVRVEGYTSPAYVDPVEGRKEYTVQLPPIEPEWPARRYRFVDEKGEAIGHVNLEKVISQTGPEVRGFRPYANGDWLEVWWPPGIEELEVELEPRAWVEQTFTVKVKPGEEVEQTVTIVKPDVSHLISGQVKSSDGTPAKNARVRLRKVESTNRLFVPGDAHVFTDAEGRYELRIHFPRLHEATVEIGAGIGTVSSQFQKKTIKPGNNQIDFVLPETAPLQVVLDPELARSFPWIRIVDEHEEIVAVLRHQSPERTEWEIETAPVGKLRAYVTTGQAGLLIHDNDSHLVEVKVKRGRNNVLELGGDALQKPVDVRVQFLRDGESVAPEAQMIIKCVRVGPDFRVASARSWVFDDAMNWDYQVRAIHWSAHDEALLSLLPGRYIILRATRNAEGGYPAEGGVFEVLPGFEQTFQLEMQKMEFSVDR